MQVQSPVVSPQVFLFDSSEVRTLLIDGEPWFVAADVATVLGYEKPRNAVSAHCKGALKRGVLTNGGNQDMTIIPERDVYRLIMRSKLPSAERFEEWVVGNVLPSIRKTGSYGIPALPTDPMAILRLTFEALEKQQQELTEVKSDIQFIKDNVRLHAWQCKELQLAVNVKVNEFHKMTGVDYKQLYPGVWNKLKLKMQVNSYQSIPAVQFDNALAVVTAFTIRDMPDYVKAQALDLQGGAA